MKLFGLLGKKLTHSFSKKYFTEKFERDQNLDHKYELFELDSIDQFPALLSVNANLVGMNVTIPYKEAVIDYLDELDESASNVGAVNVIKFDEAGRSVGYNSDYHGFKSSLTNKAISSGFELKFCKALVLGTGGASKAVQAALKDMDIEFKIVSRDESKSDYTYESLGGDLIREHTLIINTTPLGMYPDVESFPDINYNYITNKHLLFDLVYNPVLTTFMSKGKEQDALVSNGLEMLHLQAEKAWQIWND